MNVKISVFVIRVEAIIYLLLQNLHECTFSSQILLIDLLLSFRRGEEFRTLSKWSNKFFTKQL